MGKKNRTSSLYAFYAANRLLNVKNHQLYSDKFTLSVVDLTQTELVVEDDKIWPVFYWAKLFKAATWEEITMISQK